MLTPQKSTTTPVVPCDRVEGAGPEEARRTCAGRGAGGRRRRSGPTAENSPCDRELGSSSGSRRTVNTHRKHCPLSRSQQTPAGGERLMFDHTAVELGVQSELLTPGQVLEGPRGDLGISIERQSGEARFLSAPAPPSLE